MAEMSHAVMSIDLREGKRIIATMFTVITNRHVKRNNLRHVTNPAAVHVKCMVVF